MRTETNATIFSRTRFLISITRDHSYEGHCQRLSTSAHKYRKAASPDLSNSNVQPVAVWSPQNLLTSGCGSKSIAHENAHISPISTLTVRSHLMSVADHLLLAVWYMTSRSRVLLPPFSLNGAFPDITTLLTHSFHHMSTSRLCSHQS